MSWLKIIPDETNINSKKVNSFSVIVKSINHGYEASVEMSVVQ